MKAIIYARVSTEEQEKGYSLEAQIEECKKYCESKGWKVVKVYREVKSAANIKRDELSKAIEMVKLGVADILVAWKIDRITRSIKDFVFLTEELMKEKDGEKYIAFTSVRENLDLTTAVGRAFASIVTIFAQLEREMISERTKMGFKEGEGSWETNWLPKGPGSNPGIEETKDY